MQGCWRHNSHITEGAELKGGHLRDLRPLSLTAGVTALQILIVFVPPLLEDRRLEKTEQEQYPYCLTMSQEGQQGTELCLLW